MSPISGRRTICIYAPDVTKLATPGYYAMRWPCPSRLRADAITSAAIEQRTLLAQLCFARKRRTPQSRIFADVGDGSSLSRLFRHKITRGGY